MGYWDSVSSDQHHDRMWERKSSGAMGSTSWHSAEDEREINYDRTSKNKKEIENMSSQISSLQKQLKEQAEAQKKAKKKKPKREGDQQIKPDNKPSQAVEDAKKKVDAGPNGDQPSAWEQAQANSADNTLAQSQATDNPSATSEAAAGTQTSFIQSDEKKEQAQDLADKYKLALISSGATAQNQTDFTAKVPEQHMSSDQILAADAKQYGGKDGTGWSSNWNPNERPQKNNGSGSNDPDQWDQYDLPDFTKTLGSVSGGLTGTGIK